MDLVDHLRASLYLEPEPYNKTARSQRVVIPIGWPRGSGPKGSPRVCNSSTDAFASQAWTSSGLSEVARADGLRRQTARREPQTSSTRCLAHASDPRGRRHGHQVDIKS